MIMKTLRDTVVLILILTLVWLIAHHVTGLIGMKEIWRSLAIYLSAVAGILGYVVAWTFMEEYL